MAKHSLETILAQLGRRQDDPDLLSFLHTLNPDATIDRLDEDDDFSCELPSLGLEFAFDNSGRVRVMFFFNGPISGDDQTRPYVGALPGQLKFNMGRGDVRRTLGEPSRSGEATRFRGASVLAWDVFAWNDLRIHVAYAETEDRVAALQVWRHEADQTAYREGGVVTSCRIWWTSTNETLYFNEIATDEPPATCEAINLTGRGTITFKWLGFEWVKIGDHLAAGCSHEFPGRR